MCESKHYMTKEDASRVQASQVSPSRLTAVDAVVAALDDVMRSTDMRTSRRREATVRAPAPSLPVPSPVGIATRMLVLGAGPRVLVPRGTPRAALGPRSDLAAVVAQCVLVQNMA